MKPERSLRKRIARDFVVLALILSGFFCLVAYVAVEVIEAQVIDNRLDKIGAEVIERSLRGEKVDLPPEIDFYVGAAAPAQLRNLAPGAHEVALDGREFKVQVRMEAGRRFVVAQDMTSFLQAELLIFSSLFAGLLSSLLLAVVLGHASARRIVAPIGALAEAVGTQAPPQDLPSLGAQDEIGILARAFAARTDQLQQFLLRERLFTGDVSHELRTPLTIMLGASELLAAQLADRPDVLATVERLRRVAAETTGRVSALLLLSRSPEQLDAPLIDLGALVQAEIDRYCPLLKGKPVECRYEQAAPVHVAARPELAGIAVGNLLRNACQHVERGHVLVRLEADRLVVEDTGPGIPEAVRARLFERFVRGATEDGQGSGLGLSIVKRVAEHIGWTVRLETPAGGGSRFILGFAAL
jgi:signal transduction histidine kinase